MSPEEKLEFEANCTEQLEEIKHLILQLEEQVKPISPDVGLGRLTRMEAIQAKSINESTLNDLKIKKSNIESRLKQINNPDFGLCINCNKPINPARLAYLPESDVCVNCA